MANIHGMEDANQGGNGRAQINGGQQNPLSFLPGQGESYAAAKPPRQENFWDMWMLTFCPRFNLKSFTFCIIWIELAYYLGLLIYTGVVTNLNSNSFLGPSLKALQHFGMRMPQRVYQSYEFHRLLLPSFMFFGFSHMVIGLFAQLILGSVVESVMGPLKLAFFYLIVMIGSNIFGAVCSSTYSIGPDPIIFALIGCLFAMFALYWPRMGDDWKPKVCMIVSLVMILVVTIMLLVSQYTMYQRYTTANNIFYPDVYGCIGGFIFGVSSGFMFLPTDRIKTKAEKAMYIVGLVVTPTLMLALFLSFFLASKPTKGWYISDKPLFK